MCLDAGAEYQCYASDVTRTFPLSGSWPSTEAKDIYDLVQDMQTACIERIRRGAVYSDLNILARWVMTRGLLGLGILRGGTVKELYDAGVWVAFFPHGLGHHIGLDVHDVDSISLRSNQLTPETARLKTLSDSELSHLGEEELSRMTAQFKDAVPKCSSLCTLPSGLYSGMVVTVEPGM